MNTKFFDNILICCMTISLLFCISTVSPAEIPQPVPGGKVVYAIPGNPDTLDPQATTGTLTFQHVKSVYDTLLEPNSEGKLVPALAESWKFSLKEMTLTFALRQDVTFHNGDHFTAADVKATFDRMLSPDSTSPHQDEFEAIEEVKILDDSTVCFVLNRTSIPLLASFASGWGAILPKRAIEEGHDFSTHPLGTGPFMFNEWVRDDHLTYQKFPEYWKKGLPYLDEMELKVVVDPTIQLQGLLIGEFDIIHSLEPHNTPKVKENPETKLFTHPTALALVATMNHARPPLDNVLVRRAISYAIDRRALLDIAYTGGTEIGAFIDSGSPYFSDYSAMYRYNPEKAKALLSEAGYADGFNITITLPQNYTPHVNAGNMIQNMLKQVGIRAEIELVEWGTWLSQVYRGRDYNMTVIGHTGKLDPHGRLKGFGNPEENYANYDNAEVYKLINQAVTEPSFKTRKTIYTRIQRLMAEDAVMVFIGTMDGLRGMRSNVYGFRMTYALDTPDFSETFKVK